MVVRQHLLTIEFCSSFKAAKTAINDCISSIVITVGGLSGELTDLLKEDAKLIEPHIKAVLISNVSPEYTVKWQEKYPIVKLATNNLK